MKHHENCDLMEPASFGTMGNKCTCGALALAGVISGIDGVDSLLAEAGYSEDSSTRHQLSIVRSMVAARYVRADKISKYHEEAEALIYRLMDRLIDTELDEGGIGLIKEAKRFINWDVPNVKVTGSPALSASTCGLPGQG